MPDQPNDLTRAVFRAEIAAVNAHLAETGPSAPADADLRYQVLHALDFAYCNGIGYETPEQLLDAYDAHRPVLPAPADRAAIYRSLADHYDRIAGAAFPGDKTDWYEAIADVAAGLRRMADEAQQAEPEPTLLRWGLDDVQYGDDDSITVMLSGPNGESYWLELDAERAAVLRQDLSGPDTEADEAAQVKLSKPTIAYSGKGRVWCLACPRPVDEDVPLNANDVNAWDLCPSCGRHVVDVAQAQQAEAPRQWCKCPSCWGWFVEEHPGEDLDDLGKDLRWWSGLPEHRDPPADEAQQAGEGR